jgi:hypothetical protein
MVLLVSLYRNMGMSGAKVMCLGRSALGRT